MSTGFTPSHRGGAGAPLVCLHGFTDTWRTWELVLPALEARHDVLAPTLAGHAGGPPLPAAVTDETLADGVERAMDEAGIGDAHLVGNSLGGFVALQVAARGRARSVVALAPAGGWAEGDPAFAETIAYFRSMREMLKNAVAHADAIAASPEGRRLATEYVAVNYEHIPAELVAHLMRGAAACDVPPLLAHAERVGWNLEAERIGCPVRIVWGDADRILIPPGATARFREEWLPQAEWVELGAVGHCPQLDVPLETAELALGLTDPGGG
ncbi:MAG: alpha/beta hydrolase [Solirubrobacterales bacterium]